MLLWVVKKLDSLPFFKPIQSFSPLQLIRLPPLYVLLTVIAQNLSQNVVNVQIFEDQGETLLVEANANPNSEVALSAPGAEIYSRLLRKHQVGFGSLLRCFYQLTLFSQVIQFNQLVTIYEEGTLIQVLSFILMTNILRDMNSYRTNLRTLVQ